MRAAALIFALVVLAGCGGGPDEATLARDVGQRLGEALPADTVSMAALHRRGSQSDTKAPAGETRRIVYFDVELKFAKDFDMGAWDGPGVSGLVSALGAGPKGVTGLAGGGNRQGDILYARGTALYKKEGERWVPVATGGFRPSVAPAYATNAPQGPNAVLDAMRKVVDSVPKDASPAHREAVEQELNAAYAAIRARLARAADGYAIAAGAEHGQYMRFSQALGVVSGARVATLITHGGEENLRLLRDGKVTLALTQGDAALDAYEGKGAFAQDGAYPALRTVGSLYPEAVHVLVRADSPLSSVSSLKGRRIAVGEEGSASRTTVLRVLQAHGIAAGGFKPVEGGLGDALVALGRGDADAVIQVIGVPADSVRAAITQVPLRLVPLDAGAVATLARSPAYFAHVIPGGAYATQKSDVRTVATAALLMVAPDMSDSEVARVTRLVYEKGRDLAARGSVQGTQVSVANARKAVPVPMHLAASRTLDALAAEKPAR